MTKVAAIKADSYDPQIVQQAITDLLAHLGGMSQFILPGDRVFAGSGGKMSLCDYPSAGYSLNTFSDT